MRIANSSSQKLVGGSIVNRIRQGQRFFLPRSLRGGWVPHHASRAWRGCRGRRRSRRDSGRW
jgi:hypothetical protein